MNVLHQVIMIMHGGNNYVLKSLNIKKIAKNPALLTFVRTDLVPQHWRRLHSKIRSKPKVHV